MIKYFKERRKKEMEELLKETLQEAKRRKTEASKDNMVGKDLYGINIEEVQTTYDIIQVLELFSKKATFVMSEEEAKKFNKYLIKK